MAYYHHSLQLSGSLIQALLNKKIALIGLAFPKLRRKEYSLLDQHCANQGVFVIENMVNLNLIENQSSIIYTFPMKVKGWTGLPCRMVSRK